MPQSRQLAAIMFTDIVGYTALMGGDEQKAFELYGEEIGEGEDVIYGLYFPIFYPEVWNRGVMLLVICYKG